MRESDQLIVLGGWESHSPGEGADSDTKPAKETLTGLLDRKRHANLPVGNSEESCIIAAHADASITEEPGAGKPHAGICAGAVG